MLYEKLLSKGYKIFEIKYRVADDRLNLINIENKLRDEFSVNSCRLDIKI